MTIGRFIEAVDRSERSLVVVNREEPRQVQAMLEGLFEDQSVEVRETDRPDEEGDVVYLVEDGDVLASSSLAEIRDTILLVNSDLYITGARTPADLDLPTVIEGLENVRFTVRGYPESNKGKLLLITLSRHIERLALESSGGKHRASFQRLSRIEDEHGTRHVYERLADSPVDTHVYGIPDWTPPPEFDVTIHGGYTEDFRNSWFVVFEPASDDDARAALVAHEIDPRVYEGFWTYDADRVAAIARHIEREL